MSVYLRAEFQVSSNFSSFQPQNKPLRSPPRLGLRKPRVAIFADIIKIATIFLKEIFKGSKKLKDLGNMYQNTIYV